MPRYEVNVVTEQKFIVEAEERSHVLQSTAAILEHARRQKPTPAPSLVVARRALGGADGRDPDVAINVSPRLTAVDKPAPQEQGEPA